jgi:hypothetical protein
VGSLRFGDAQLPNRDSLAFVAVPAQAGYGDPGDARVRQVLWGCDRQKRTGAWVGRGVLGVGLM